MKSEYQLVKVMFCYMIIMNSKVFGFYHDFILLWIKESSILIQDMTCSEHPGQPMVAYDL